MSVGPHEPCHTLLHPLLLPHIVRLSRHTHRALVPPPPPQSSGVSWRRQAYAVLDRSLGEFGSGSLAVIFSSSGSRSGHSFRTVLSEVTEFFPRPNAGGRSYKGKGWLR